MAITDEHQISQIKPEITGKIKPNSKNVTNHENRFHLVPNEPLEIADRQFISDFIHLMHAMEKLKLENQISAVNCIPVAHLKELLRKLKVRLNKDISNLKYRTKLQLVDAWLADLHP